MQDSENITDMLYQINKRILLYGKSPIDEKRLAHFISPSSHTLAEREKTYLIMRYMHNKSYEKIAEECHCSRATVETYVAAGIRKIGMSALTKDEKILQFLQCALNNPVNAPDEKSQRAITIHELYDAGFMDRRLYTSLARINISKETPLTLYDLSHLSPKSICGYKSIGKKSSCQVSKILKHFSMSLPVLKINNA